MILPAQRSRLARRTALRSNRCSDCPKWPFTGGLGRFDVGFGVGAAPGGNLVGDCFPPPDLQCFGVGADRVGSDRTLFGALFEQQPRQCGDNDDKRDRHDRKDDGQDDSSASDGRLLALVERATSCTSVVGVDLAAREGFTGALGDRG